MSPSRKTSQERREEIVRAAIKIIVEQGLREFTAAKLAEEVGIKDGTIFRHFKDKQEILSEVLESIEQALLESAPEPNPDPLARLEGFLMSRVQVVSSQPGLMSLIFSDQLAHAMGEAGGRRVAALRNRGRGFIKSCLQEAVDKKLLPPKTDVESAVLIINGLVMSLLFASKDGALEAPIEEVAARALENTLALLRRS